MNIGDIGKTWTEIAQKASDEWNWQWAISDVTAMRLALDAGAITTAQQRCEGGFRLLARRVGR